MDAGADAVNRQQGVASRRIVQAKRLDEQELRALELPVFLGRDDGTNDLCELQISYPGQSFGDSTCQ